MIKLQSNKIRLTALAAILGFSLVSAPASAHHDGGLVAPLAAAIVLGAIISQHQHHYRYRYDYRYGRHGHGGHRYQPHRPRSYSDGGYSRHKRHNHW